MDSLRTERITTEGNTIPRERLASFESIKQGGFEEGAALNEGRAISSDGCESDAE